MQTLGYQRVNHLDGGHDSRLAWKDLVDEAGVNALVQIRATILDDDDAIVSIGRVERGREDGAACRDPKEDQRVDVVGAEQSIEIRTGKCIDAVLGDDDLAGLRRDGYVYSAAIALKKELVRRGGFHGAEEDIARTRFWNAGAEADFHVKHRNAHLSRRSHHLGRARQERGVFYIERDDAGLHVEAEDRGSRHIDLHVTIPGPTRRV